MNTLHFCDEKIFSEAKLVARNSSNCETNETNVYNCLIITFALPKFNLNL